MMIFFFSVQAWVQLQWNYSYIYRFELVGINAEKFNSVVFATLTMVIFNAP